MIYLTGIVLILIITTVLLFVIKALISIINHLFKQNYRLFSKEIAPSKVIITLLLVGIVFTISSDSSFLSMEKVVKVEPAANKYGLVIKGEDGYLFYGQEIYAIDKEWPDQTEKFSSLQAYFDSLHVKLLIVPLPMKVEFYGNKMSDRPATYTCEKRYSFIESLIKKHIRTIDILPALRVQAEHAPIWMKEDSHWNNNGIIAAAGMISDSIKHYTKKGTTNFLVKDTCFTYLGDLKSLSGGNDSFTLHTKTIRYGNGSPYVNDTTSSILIFGDSFIDIPGRQNGNLSEFIAYYLGKPVHSHCSVGGNTEGIRLLKKMKKTIVKKKIVVWIFSSRYLYINFSE